MKLGEILNKLDKVRRTGSDKYVACCPAHDDSDPSLSVTLSDRKILMHCFAGCNKGEILDAIGLEMHNLFLDENYGKACCSPIDTGVDQSELDKIVLEIAASDLEQGKLIRAEDKARVALAIRRLGHG